MKLRRKISLCVLMVLTALCLIAGVCAMSIKANAYTDRVELTSNTGDMFKAVEASYTKDESFVFSATVNFGSGDAAALTFGETEKGLWAFNMDRVSNRVKLLYFTKGEEGAYSAKELLSEHFIGNAKMTSAERNMVEPEVRKLSSVSLKVELTAKEGANYLACYADGIRRFAYTDGSAPANEINLNTAFENLSYEGGNLGYNVCNADAYFSDTVIGANDTSYYGELYRNSFHFSQFAHWNNDPNGLVYYNGYYHLYYQHNPFDKVWGAMYWGHARSKDLIHWENLPICLFPERGKIEGNFGVADNYNWGDGYMWSGCARIYHKGESTVIDGEKWFGENSAADGEALGLIGFYTRDGAKQDQMIMSSSDGGLTWTKRRLIPSQDILGLGEAKTDCRDPKVFTYQNGSSTVYGMLLTGMCEPYNVWFLRSDDLVNWTPAGGFKAKVPLVNTQNTNGPECPDIAFITADDGEEKAVITLAGRGYIVGDLSYENNKFVFKANGRDVAEYSLEEAPVKQMDFGPDSYATQTFYIEDGVYAGKAVSVSWFSGVPGASASVDSGLLTQLRSRWNCGMTIPVIWGLKEKDGDYLLTQTPVTQNLTSGKTAIASVSERRLSAGEDILKNLKATAFEINAEIENPECGAVSFKVRTGNGEYTEIGWNKEEGYYVDRTHTSSGNLSLPNYAGRYAAATGDDTLLTFDILSDNGGIEVFCGEGTCPFYAVTFSSPNSDGMSLVCEKDVTLKSLKINKIENAWNALGNADSLLIGNDEVELDLTLCRQKDVLVSGGNVKYEVADGKVVSYMNTEGGIRLFAEGAGETRIKVTSGESVQYINVTVYGGAADSDCEFNSIKSGDWYVSDNGYKGYIKASDAFILSQREGANFMYSAVFDLRSGIAAALVFRASEDMSSYVIANYDDGAGLVKLWSSAGDSYQVGKKAGDLNDLVLTVIADGAKIKVYFNNELLIDCTLSEEAPESGLFGLNVCAADVLFKSVSVTDNINCSYTEGEISWRHTDASAFTVVNRSLKNSTVDAGFLTADGRKVTLSQNYLASLPYEGEYLLEVRGKKSLYHISLNVQKIPLPVWEDLKLEQSGNAVFFIGSAPVKEVKVNGNVLDGSLYKVDGMTLTVYSDAFNYGVNEVSAGGGLSAKVTVNDILKLEEHFNASNKGVIYTVLFVIVGVVLAAEAALIAVILLKKNKDAEEEKKDGGND